MTAEELRELRESTGLSRAEACRLFKTPYRTFQNWENGSRRVPPMVGELLKLYKEKESSHEDTNS